MAAPDRAEAARTGAARAAGGSRARRRRRAPGRRCSAPADRAAGQAGRARRRRRGPRPRSAEPCRTRPGCWPRCSRAPSARRISRATRFLLGRAPRRLSARRILGAPWRTLVEPSSTSRSRQRHIPRRAVQRMRQRNVLLRDVRAALTSAQTCHADGPKWKVDTLRGESATLDRLRAQGKPEGTRKVRLGRDARLSSFKVWARFGARLERGGARPASGAAGDERRRGRLPSPE